jgi:N-acetylglutamate synthase-like GNAT family acetyltransferase
VDKVTVRDAVIAESHAIHAVLSEAFVPHRDYYTEEAYNITVCKRQEIQRRIDDKLTDVIVATHQGMIVGTAALHYKEQGRLYLSSMAVKPMSQGKGIGYYLLKEVEQRAKKKKCTVILLECCEFLKMAIGLYKRMGYERTGKKRPYYGVEVFEMEKSL